MSKPNRNIKKPISTVSHPNGPCGNPGCKKCFPVNFRQFLVKGQPKNMPQWMWQMWNELSKSEQKRAAL